ncbi:MAG TPA: polysaccharide deacetylase family protein [Mucilaginibacter sp.]|jgi:peptidoglycan/xylan/chitin deacetylase (PgdA/CDA1 family)|nr:polysaccharide deacetylase family protein [Mucilaginibacter sp.]
MKRLIFLLTLISITAHAQQKMVWPHHKKSVIILTYDDALPSQLKTAVPQLEKANLTATFFLTGASVDKSITQWREVAKAGFELGNHTIYHPCTPENDNPTSSATYTTYQMCREIQVMNTLLFAIDGHTTRTFSYPCTDTLAGGKSYISALKQAGLIKYGRLGGDATAIVTDFDHLDPLLVPSYGLDKDTPASALIDYVKHVQQVGGMGIIMFHGIGGDWIKTSPEDHQQLVDYLKTHHKEIWIATFQQAMDYITRSKVKMPLKEKAEKPALAAIGN